MDDNHNPSVTEEMIEAGVAAVRECIAADRLTDEEVVQAAYLAMRAADQPPPNTGRWFQDEEMRRYSDELRSDTRQTDVERVARALCSYEANKGGIWFDHEALQKHIFNNWRNYKGPAKAALAAMPQQPVFEEAINALLTEPQDDIAWVRQQLGKSYAPGCAIEQHMLGAIERGRLTAPQQPEPPTALDTEKEK